MDPSEEQEMAVQPLFLIKKTYWRKRWGNQEVRPAPISLSPSLSLSPSPQNRSSKRKRTKRRFNWSLTLILSHSRNLTSPSSHNQEEERIMKLLSIADHPLGQLPLESSIKETFRGRKKGLVPSLCLAFFVPKERGIKTEAWSHLLQPAHVPGFLQQYSLVHRRALVQPPVARPSLLSLP